MDNKETYLVLVGKKPGIYSKWVECKREVDGFSNAVYCKFNTKAEALAAQSNFLEDRNWCSKNHVYICPSCQKCIRFEISNARETIGCHYYRCKSADCCHFEWVANLRKASLHQKSDIIGGSSTSSSSSKYEATEYEAIEAELLLTQQQRDVALMKCDVYKELICEFVNIKMKDN